MIWIFLLKLTIVPLMTLPPRSSSAEERHRARTRPPVQPPLHSKRGLNIGLQLKIPETSNDTLKTIERQLAKAIGKGLDGGKGKGGNPAGKAEEEKLELKRLLLKPAFECDQWDYKTRTCWLDRNTGDTVTFSLSTGVRTGRRARPDVVWKKEFAHREAEPPTEYVINPNRTSRNLVIGRRGYELRVSPITEIDVDDNQFSAAFASEHVGPAALAKVNFRIRVVPEDLGFVYIGETLDLSIESYVTLPLESVTYHWYTEKEGESASLPSNMRVSHTGETLRVSELRQEQEGVLACSVYTNKGMHATKKRFLVKELTKNKDVLKSFSDHALTYQEQEEHQKLRRRASRYRGRRVAVGSSTKVPPGGRRTTPAKRSPKTARAISDANVEGEQYTYVRPYNEADVDARQAQADDGAYSMGSMIFGNASDSEAVLNIDVDRDRNAEEDTVSRLVSSCFRDLQCSKHASCVRTSLRESGFCRCLQGFYGPGIFCREEM